MNIKSLLLGSAAALVAATGARAADAIVIAEPEPMEYVRICDVYGAGFFYIPGTENCLKIGGYIRYQMTAGDEDYWFRNEGVADSGYTKYARFAPTFDVRTDTAWGTLRGFAELEFDWYSVDGTQSTNLNHAFIEIGNPGGVLRIGKGDTPYARFLGYGHSGWVDGGNYGFSNRSEVSYTFTSGGFSGIVAVVEDIDGVDWTPDAEAGVRYSWAPGSFIGAIAGYDESDESWGAKVVLDYTMGAFYAELAGFYSSQDGISAGGGTYSIPDSAGRLTEWSVAGDIGYTVSPMVRLGLSAQYFDTETWEAGAQVAYSPFGNSNLVVKLEGRYYSDLSVAADDQDGFAGFLRFDRNF